MIDTNVFCEGASNMDEQETSINIDYQTQKASVYSSKPKVIKMLQTLLETCHEDTECLVLNERGIEISMPASWIKIKKPASRSEQWKQAARKR